MIQTILGKSGMEVSRIAFGTWQLGGEWGPTDTEAATGAIRRATERGVTFFDTAQAYGFGRSEQLLAAAFRGLPRERFIIATKGGLRATDSGLERDASVRWIREGVEASLRSLDTTTSTCIRCTSRSLNPVGRDGHGARQASSRRQGPSCGGLELRRPADRREFSSTLPVETMQPPYHLFRRGIESDLLPYATDDNIGVLVYGPLAHGLLGGHLGPETRFAPG